MTKDTSPGTAGMYIIHSLVTSSRDQLADLDEALNDMSRDSNHGIPGPVYCRQAMQLTFAADQHIGKLIDQREERGNHHPQLVGDH